MAELLRDVGFLSGGLMSIFFALWCAVLFIGAAESAYHADESPSETWIDFIGALMFGSLTCIFIAISISLFRAW